MEIIEICRKNRYFFLSFIEEKKSHFVIESIFANQILYY